MSWSPQIISAFITGGVALITGMLVSLIAWRQWRTAKDKLALDLFDRRYAAWKAILEKLHERRLEKVPPRHGGVTWPRPITEGEQALQKAVRESKYLFGPEVHALLNRLDDIVTEYKCVGEECQIYSTETGGLSLELIRKSADSIRGVEAVITQVEMAIEPYMMVDRIAVNRPAKHRHRDWGRNRPGDPA